MLIKPIIGITLDWDGGIYRLNEAYVKAVIDAGGIPVCLPYVEAEDGERIIQAIDGLLLTGGGMSIPFYLAKNLCRIWGGC